MRKTSISSLVTIQFHNLLFFIGTEGTEAITHINTSFDGKYVSICERNVAGEKGLVTIYEIISSKKRQTLPDAPDQQNRFKSQEFVCSAFSPRREEIIVTLCGAPDWQVLLWDWDKCRLLSQCSVGLSIPQQMKPCIF
jgi:cilia- and flagella-associated protein 57